ncbi:MAG: hypothetical protein NC238_02935 [Dehalobacter sp.]|nr:hypothetical protein [Dehalobacter sp.]
MTNDAITITRDFLELLNLIEKEWPDWWDDVKKSEGEIQDLLHEIEFTKFDACHGYQLSKQIKAVRQHRRKMKEQIEALRPLKEYVDNNKQLKITLYKVLSAMEKTVQNQGSRIYTPRVRTDMEQIRAERVGAGGE